MNALEDVVNAYLRRVKNFPVVDRNIATAEDEGEVDAVGINFDPLKVLIVEAAAGVNLYGRGRLTEEKVVAKFERAINHVRKQKWFRDAPIAIEFWAPHVTAEKKAILGGLKIGEISLQVIDGEELVRRLAAIQKTVKGVDVKTLDSVSQLLRLLPDIVIPAGTTVVPPTVLPATPAASPAPDSANPPALLH